MKKLLLIIIFIQAYAQCLYAQDEVQQRIILIGDAGEINTAQKAILTDAISRSLPGKTMALFLGDNVYPRGIELSGDKKIASEIILRSQFEGLRKNNTPVYFIPGNHDWDKSGPDGYDKMKAANSFIAAQQDSLLKMIPEDACPGPYELTVSSNLVIIAMDSEWWLYPFDNHTGQGDCTCKTKRDVLGKLEDIVRRNSDKLIIFATHHPFKTYGTHGGYYTFREHLFPFTDLNKSLYIPLPVIGSLYPLLRKAFPPAEDLGNALNKDMQQSVDAILKTHPNVVHVSGHEHTLQLIQGEVLQVVSGAGAKHTPVKKGKESLFAAANSGYTVADILKDNNIRLTFFSFINDSIQQSFVYTKPYQLPGITGEITADKMVADSIHISLKRKYDSVTKMHRNLFGENYRKVWSQETTLPVLHISAAQLKPEELGGGMQTRSLRLLDTAGKEWVIRSINKFPDALLPQALSQTFASNILEDNFSANFPYAPLTVPVIADALGVPHSNPSVVYVAPDKQLGIYSRDFANTVVLLEEREPLGKSISTLKMDEKLKEDNDNAVDQYAFLTARMQDIFLGDWDRHGDQWRWVDEIKGKEKLFMPVPRDRDQVFYTNQGLFPSIATLPWILPKLQGFGAKIKNINTFNFNARLIDGIYTNALSYDEWQKATNEVVTKLSDTVIKNALQKLPANVYQATQSKLFDQLQKRRQELLRVMPVYYSFVNKTIDLVTSDKNELVIINDTLDKKLSVSFFKITKENTIEKLLYKRVLDPAVTKELRLYINGGKDNVVVRNHSSPVIIRIVGDGVSAKQYGFSGNAKYLRKIHVYEGDTNAVFTGRYNPVHRHLSNEASNTALRLTDRYNKSIPLFGAGYNADDGFFLGAGLKWISQGFRKQPYSSVQQFMLAHSFLTAAYRVIYKGEWLNALNHADITLQATAYAPANTQNFFGRGNATTFDKTGDYKTYYRTRFNYYNVNPALRWRNRKNNSFSIGPSLQYYHCDAEDNTGRFITQTDQLHSYDSATIYNDKTHIGLTADFTHEGRKNLLLPTFGTYLNFRLQGYNGLNSYSKSYLQFTGQFAFYKSLDRKSNIVIANRTGGGFTAGKATFYQSIFLGGHNNLQGYHQYRFAGESMLYNNFETRIKLANLASYILPGQLGLVAFYDIGKVWQEGYDDHKWHQGVGGGLYFAPAQLFVFQMVMGYSKEGWYPYFSAGFRF
jgi:Omp85 superfamily domain/Calcineurin-like phosphoesterase